jgi:hypothetical protein
MIINDPYEAESIMVFTALVSCNGSTSKTYTLIDTTTSLNIVSKEFLMAKCFYNDCKTALKLYTREAIEHHISKTKVFCPSVFTINGRVCEDVDAALVYGGEVDEEHV